MRYQVNTCRDNTDDLQEHVVAIGEGGGRVVSVLWVPVRPIPYNPPNTWDAGYVIVSEWKDEDANRT